MSTKRSRKETNEIASTNGKPAKKAKHSQELDEELDNIEQENIEHSSKQSTSIEEEGFENVDQTTPPASTRPVSAPEKQAPKKTPAPQPQQPPSNSNSSHEATEAVLKTPENLLEFVEPSSKMVFKASLIEIAQCESILYQKYNANLLPNKTLSEDNFSKYTQKQKSPTKADAHSFWIIESLDASQNKYGLNVKVLPFMILSKFSYGGGFGKPVPGNPSELKNTFFIEVTHGLAVSQLKVFSAQLMSQQKRMFEIQYATALKCQSDFLRGMKAALDYWSVQLFNDANFGRGFKKNIKDQIESDFIKTHGVKSATDAKRKEEKEALYKARFFAELKKNSMLVFPNETAETPTGFQINWSAWKQPFEETSVDSGDQSKQSNKPAPQDADKTGQTSGTNNSSTPSNSTTTKKSPVVFANAQSQAKYNKYIQQGYRWRGPELLRISPTGGSEEIIRKNAKGQRDDAASYITSGSAITFDLTWKPSEKGQDKVSLKLQLFGTKITVVGMGSPMKITQNANYGILNTGFRDDQVYEKETPQDGQEAGSMNFGMSMIAPPPTEEDGHGTDAD